MKNNRTKYWKSFQALLAFLLISGMPQMANAGRLLDDMNRFLSGGYPVAMAYLSLYDSNGDYIGTQKMDASDLLNSGIVNTGSEIIFNGSLSFPELFPLLAGGAGGSIATIHDFSIDLDTAYNSPFTDLVTMQIDWSRLNLNQVISQPLSSYIADDFENGIAYYGYEGYPAQSLSYGSASFSLEFATGVPPEVPLPASVWLFGSGLVGLIGIARRKKSQLYKS